MKWIKSSRCDSGSCVEVRRRGPVIEMRDPKNPDWSSLVFTAPEWVEFLAALKALGHHPHNVSWAADGSVTVHAPMATSAVLVFTAKEWAAFESGVHDGEFDLGRVPA